jgi:6-phosphogluconolactonase
MMPWGAILVLAGLVAAPEPGGTGTIDVYVGTYTDGASRGIYRLTLDTATGAMTEPALVAETANPSFLALSPDHRYLYAVNETGNFDAEGSGGVSAFAVDAGRGPLRLLGTRSSRGADPCHLAVAPDGRHVIVANYTGGNLAVLPVVAGGALGSGVPVQPRAGLGPRKDRQEAPHAHDVVFDPSGRFLLAADLGADRIFVYRYSPAPGTLEPNDPPSAALPPGSGPRHLAFHPSGRAVYVINELASTIDVFSWDGERGRLEPVQTVSTLPPDFTGENDTAEVAVSADGRFVYGSNRGHDSIAVFGVDPTSLRITLVGHVPSGGKSPRHFALDPTGRFLLAANQDSGTIQVFRIDGTSGLPSPVGPPVRVDRAVCLLPVAPLS